MLWRVRVDSDYVDYCVPQSLHAVIAHWGLPSDVEKLGAELVHEQGPTAEEVMEYLRRREDIAGVCFRGDSDVVRTLLQRGYPLILLQRILTADNYRGHASVIVGHDDSRGVFLLDDANWYWGADRIAIENLEGLRVVLVAPPDHLRTVAGSLPGQEFCALLNEAEHALGRGGEPARAETALGKAVALEPESYLPHLYLGMLAQRRGNMEAASERFQRATSLPGADAEAWFRWGVALLVRGALDEAQRALQGGLEVETRLPDLHGFLAEVYLRKGKIDAALEAARRLVKLFPSHGRGRALLGEVLARQGAIDEAIGELRLSILHGGPPSAHFVLGNLLARQGEPELAIQEIERFCELETDPEKKSQAQALLDKLQSTAV